ncbi:hypothetical protein BURCENBC7_AP0919 [Burkholderia cenocepacia BC7]|nr:hypothetical protein BURCENK562V_C0821 [Burkholderia cenocepacia K56-2Valvano]ERI26624.1 hypothetical protein BURCENBC7_AP0919 [Burkholderia cenocepacia BC7]
MAPRATRALTSIAAIRNPRRPGHRGPRNMPGTALALRSDSRPTRETPT